MSETTRKTKPFRPLTRLQHLHQASRAIAAARDEATVGQALVDFAVAGDVHAVRLFIFTDTVDGQPTAIEMREGWTIDDRPAQAYGTRLPLADYPFTNVMDADSITVCENVETDERLNEINRQMMAVSGLKSFATVPLSAGQHWLGILFLGRNTPSTYDQELIYTWWTLTSQAAAALENQRLLARVRQEGQRQRQLARAVEATADAVVITDRTGTIQFVNTAFERSTGYTTAEALGQNTSILQSSVHDEAFYKQMWETITSGQVWQGEITNKRKDGSLYELQLVVSPIVDERGKVTRFVSVERDVTDQKQAETEREQLLADLESRAVQLQTAAEISHAASTILDPQTLIQQAVDLIRERFGLYYAGLFLVDKSEETGRWAVLRAGTGEAGQQMLAKAHRLEIGGDSMIGSCVATAQARIALDVGAKAQRFDNPHLPLTRSEMTLPLISRGQVIGAMTLQSAQEAAFSEEDISALQTMADQLANAIQNARMFEETQVTLTEAETLAQEQAVLNELGQSLTARLSVEEVLDKAYRDVSRLLDATNFYIGLYDPYKDEIAFPINVSESQIDKEITIMPADQGLSGYIVRNRTSVLIEENVIGWLEEMGMEQVGQVSASWLGVPLMIGEQVLGMMSIQSYTTPRLYNEHSRDLLTTIANQVAIAIQNARLFQETNRRAQQLRAINDVGQAATSTLDLDAILRLIVDDIKAHFDYYIVSILMLEGEQIILRDASTIGDSSIRLEHGYVALDLHGAGLNAEAAQTGQPILINDVRDDPRYIAASELPDTLSELCIPIKVRDRITGVLDIQSTQLDAFDQADVTLFQSLANQAGAALENARLFQDTELALAETETLAQEQAVLAELGQALTARLDIDRVLTETYRGASRLLDTTNFFIALYDPQRNEIDLPFVITESEIDKQIITFPADQGIIGHIIRNRTSVLIRENATEWLNKMGIKMVGESALSWLGVPLIIGDQILGALAVQTFTTPGLYDEHDRDLLTTIANQVAIAIQNVRLLEETQAALAETEALYRASQEIGDVLDLEAVVERLADVARRMTKSDHSVVVTLDPETGTIEHLKSAGVDLERYPIVNMPEGKGILAAIFKGETVRTADITTHPQAASLPEWHFPVRSLLGMPLLYQGQVRGIMLVGNPSGQRSFDAANERMLGTFATQASTIIENARLFEAQARHRQEAETLRHVTTALTSILDVNQVLDLILEQLAKVVAYDSAAVMLVEGPNLVVAAGRGFPDTAAIINFTFAIEENPLFRQMRDNRAPLVLADAQADERFLDEGGTSYVRGWMSIPLLIRGQVIGCLSINSRQPGAFGPQEAEFGQTFANQAAMALENARMFEQTQTRARREQLIREINARVSRSMDLETVLKTTARELSQALGTSHAIIRMGAGPIKPSLDNQEH